MIERQIAGRGIRDARVLEAMRAVPRDGFFAEDDASQAYVDGAYPIGHGQTISQPYIVALMTSQLDVHSTHHVLEIGTGSGYQTALLAKLTDEVFTVERIKPLLDKAWERLSDMNIRNVHFHHGDGTLGWPGSNDDRRPRFSRILVTAAAPAIPRKLLMSQLSPHDGIAVLPVGDASNQALLRIHRHGERLTTQSIVDVRFVPLIGHEGFGDDAGSQIS